MEPQEGIKLKTSVPCVPTEESPMSTYGGGKWAGWGIRLSGPVVKPCPLRSPMGEVWAALQIHPPGSVVLGRESETTWLPNTVKRTVKLVGFQNKKSLDFNFLFL